MANMITGCRILCSIILLFVPVFSPVFYLFYLMAGLTDMIDGAVARHTRTDSAFGAKLDTIADAVFVLVCMIKLISVLLIPTWLCVWIGVIAAIKIINILYGFIIYKRFVAVHTVMNKVTGMVLFLFPLSLFVIDLKYGAIFSCVIATLAAVQEGRLIRKT